MKNFLRILFIIVSASKIFAACPAGAPVSVYYVNGMNTTLSSARAQALLLERKARHSLPSGVVATFSYSYNTNESDVHQVIQTVSQYLNDKSISYYQWIANPPGAPSYFQAAIQSLNLGATVTNYVKDPDLQLHVQKYFADLAAGRRVLLVAHSQGNFYANRSHEQMVSTSVGIVSVATPSSYTAGSGPYVTLTTDAVIQAIAGHRSANTTNGAAFILTANDYDGHSFRKSYLNGDVSGPKIVGQIVSQIAALPCPN